MVWVSEPGIIFSFILYGLEIHSSFLLHSSGEKPLEEAGHIRLMPLGASSRYGIYGFLCVVSLNTSSLKLQCIVSVYWKMNYSIVSVCGIMQCCIVYMCWVMKCSVLCLSSQASMTRCFCPPGCAAHQLHRLPWPYQCRMRYDGQMRTGAPGTYNREYRVVPCLRWILLYRVCINSVQQPYKTCLLVAMHFSQSVDWPIDARNRIYFSYSCRRSVWLTFQMYVERRLPFAHCSFPLPSPLPPHLSLPFLFLQKIYVSNTLYVTGVHPSAGLHVRLRARAGAYVPTARRRDIHTIRWFAARYADWRCTSLPLLQ